MIIIGEIFAPPLIQAQSWEEAQRKFNEVIRQMARQMQNIYTGANIPASRLVQGTKITGIETGADVTADHEAATIANQGDLAILDEVTAAYINVSDLVNIANLLTVASGKIIIGANALGTDNPGIVINDGTYDRVQLGKVNSDYALFFRDPDGNLVGDAGEVTQRYRKIFDYTFPNHATSVTLSGLTGDTAEEYVFDALWKNNGGEDTDYGIQFNNDVDTHYGFQTNYSKGGDGVAPECWHDEAYTRMWLGRADTDNYYSHGWGTLWGVSGHPRQMIGQMTREVHGSDIFGLYSFGTIWNNTADEITSMKFLATVEDGIHSGSRIIVYKKVA